VNDSRECAVAGEHWLSGLPAEMLVYCDLARSRQALDRRFAPEYGIEAVGDSLAQLLSTRLIAPIDNVFLSLAVIRNRASQSAEPESLAERSLPTLETPEPLLPVL